MNIFLALVTEFSYLSRIYINLDPGEFLIIIFKHLLTTKHINNI